MVNDKIRNVISKYEDKAFGWKLTGAGGGGYLVLVTEGEVVDTIKIENQKEFIISRKMSIQLKNIFWDYDFSEKGIEGSSLQAKRQGLFSYARKIVHTIARIAEMV